MLLALVQDLKHKQKNIDIQHETTFREIVGEHQLESFIAPKCCAHIRRGDRSKVVNTIQKVKADEMMDPVKHNLNKINSYTIQGGSNLHFGAMKLSSWCSPTISLKVVSC